MSVDATILTQQFLTEAGKKISGGGIAAETTSVNLGSISSMSTNLFGGICAETTPYR